MVFFCLKLRLIYAEKPARRSNSNEAVLLAFREGPVQDVRDCGDWLQCRD